MKKIYVFVLLMFSCNSFSQFFDNELDFLVFDVQDSLIKKNKVKSLLIKESIIKGGKLIPKWSKNEELLKYNKKGFLEIENIKDYPAYKIEKYKVLYEYTNNHKLKTIRKEFHSSQIVNTKASSIAIRAAGMRMTSYMPLFNKKNEIGRLRVAGTKYVKFPDFYSYKYDSLKRVKSLKGCKGDLCEFVVYNYFKDTIQIKRFDKNSNILEGKQIIENKLSKEITSKRFNDGFSTKLMMNYSLDSLVLNKNYWNSDKGLYKKEIIYFNSKNNIKKKITISKIRSLWSNGLEEKNFRDIDLFYYKDNRLIEIKRTSQGIKITQKLEYLDNGLLDKVIKVRDDRKEIKKYTYKYY